MAPSSCILSSQQTSLPAVAFQVSGKVERDSCIIQEAPPIGGIFPVSKIKNKERMKGVGLDLFLPFAEAFCSETISPSFLNSILD